MANVIELPNRDEVALQDTWDLTYLFETDDDWTASLEKLASQVERYESFKGRLSDSPDVLADCLQFDGDLERICDKLSNYAYLKTTEDSNQQHVPRFFWQGLETWQPRRVRQQALFDRNFLKFKKKRSQNF